MPLAGFDALIAGLNAPGGTPAGIPGMGLPPAAPTFPTPAVNPMASQPQPQARGGSNPLDLIAPMLALGLAFSGYRAGATGAMHGVQQNYLIEQKRRQEEAELQQRQQQIDLAASDRQERLMQQAQLREQQRQAAIMNEVESLKKMPFKTKAEYDAYVTFAEQNLGMKPNTLRSAVPFTAPDRTKDAATAVESLIKLHGPDVLTSNGLMDFDRDGDGIPEKVSITELAQLGRVPVLTDPQSGKPIVMKDVKPENLQEFDIAYKGVLEEWKAEGKDVANPAVQGKAAIEAKTRIAKASKEGLVAGTPQGAGGLPVSVQRRVDAKARGFDAQPVVKRVQVMASSIAFVNSLDPNTTNSADDQALLYAFAKAMDPDSVVREGEYATVQRYAQSWAQTFGFDVQRIFTNSPFLTAQARQNMKQTILKKYAAEKNQYDNLRKSYAGQIGRITGQGDGEDHLVDYAGAFPDSGQPSVNSSQPPTSGFSVKAPNGKTYTFATQEQLDKFKAAAGIK